MAAVWALYAGLGWRDLHAGEITRSEFLRDIARLGFVTLLVLAPRIANVWKTRQPKPPPVYCSTILD